VGEAGVPADASAVIRPIAAHSEFATCEEISRIVWGTRGQNVVPRELLMTVQRNGGLVLGAFERSGDLAGFVFGFLGMRDGRLRLCSHQLAVLPQHRGQGSGQRLKWAQRAAALARGVELVTWTFDPLEARNAYLNLHLLGAIACHYSRDHYGAMEDALNAGLPTDRFEVEWELRDRRVIERLAGKLPEHLVVGDARRSGAAVLVEAQGQGRKYPEPRLVEKVALRQPALIAVPSNFQELKRADRSLAAAWRAVTQSAFEAALGAGLVGTDFSRDGAYWFEPVARCESTP